MRNSYIKILLIGIALVFTGCEEDWLEPEPLSFYSPENAFNSPDGLDAALLRNRLGIRQDYEGNYWLHINSEYVWTDVGMQGADNSAHPHDAVTQLIPAGNPGTFVSQWYWDHAYQMIQIANLVINRIDQPEYEDPNVREELLAEAYFHRAYWYYRLVHQFGDVPYFGQEINEPKLDFQTFTREAILQSIKGDLEYAVQNLPENAIAGKVNRAAGDHLITKIYLSVREFDNAIAAASRIIDQSSHELVTERFGSGRFADDPEYDVMWDLFQKENIMANSEGILIAPNAFGLEGNSQLGEGLKTVRNWVPQWYGLPGFLYTSSGDDEQSETLGRGGGYIAPSTWFSWELPSEDPNDLRYSKHNWQKITDYWYNDPKSSRYGENFTMADYNSLTVGKDTIRRMYPFYKNKFVIPQEALGQFQGGFSDRYIFRVAETYLLRAEAYWWKGDLGNATEDVNAVRARAQASQKDPSEITIDYIFDERARELYGEEPRKTELSRVAYIMATLNRTGYSLENIHEENWYFDRVMSKNTLYNRGLIYAGHELRFAPYHIDWPIPQSAIDANTGGVINQNQGYTGASNNEPPVTQVTDED